MYSELTLCNFKVIAEGHTHTHTHHQYICFATAQLITFILCLIATHADRRLIECVRSRRHKCRVVTRLYIERAHSRPVSTRVMLLIQPGSMTQHECRAYPRMHPSALTAAAMAECLQGEIVVILMKIVT